MAEEIGDHVDRVPDPECPEIDSRCPGGNKSRNQSQCAERKVSEIDEFAHVEQAEHQPVLVHDAWNIVQRIYAEEENGEPKCALLNRAKPL